MILVGGATRMPAVGELVRQMTGATHPYRGLIPEGIVTGAALQAGILKGKIKDFLLLDVMPLSLGIEVPDGIYVKLIERNTTIPTKRSEIFTTSRDNQENRNRARPGRRRDCSFSTTHPWRSWSWPE